MSAGVVHLVCLENQFYCSAVTYFTYVILMSVVSVMA